MKNIFILLTVLLASCCSTKPKEAVTVKPEIVYVEVEDIRQIEELKAEVNLWRDSVNYLNSTITLDVYMNARKIEKIKSYISITERNPNNKKFFYGWIKRTMAE